MALWLKPSPHAAVVSRGRDNGVRGEVVGLALFLDLEKNIEKPG